MTIKDVVFRKENLLASEQITSFHRKILYEILIIYISFFLHPFPCMAKNVHLY